jgi:hypothetical protein
MTIRILFITFGRTDVFQPSVSVYAKTQLFAFLFIILPLFGDAQAQPFMNIGADLVETGFGSHDWGDYDGDGDPDLIITGFGPLSVIYRNDGEGAFTDIGAGLNGVANGSGNWGDYDSDGDLDLVITGSFANATVYRNDGGGTFTDISPSFGEIQFSTSDWGDYDGDGDLDLVITGTGLRGPSSGIYRNDGNDTFTLAERVTAVYRGSGKWGDYDGDGDLDLVITGEMNNFDFTSRIFRNDEGTFTNINAGLQSFEDSSSDWGDYDGDGDLDLIVAGETVSIAGENVGAILYRNDGNDLFSKVRSFGSNNSGATYNGKLVDIDGDGDLDAYIGGDTSRDVYRNDGSGALTAVDTGTELLVGSTPSWGDFDGDGDLDLVGRGAVYANLLANPDFSGVADVQGSGPVSVGTTGITVNFESSGSGRVAAGTFAGGPDDPLGLPEGENVSSYRMIVSILQGSLIQPSEVRFAASEFPGIVDATSVTVHSRGIGSGRFTALPSRIDGDDIVAEVGGLVGSEFVFTSSTDPLPVELASFTATPVRNTVTLEWRTVSETENLGFHVERKASASTWSDIGFLEGAGTTTAPKRYRFSDTLPPFANTIYYRLRQTDLDGTIEHSPVVQVTLISKEVALLPSVPNPFRESTRLRYKLPERGPVTLHVYDLLGRHLATLEDGEKEAGRHELVFSGHQLTAGTYFVRLSAGGRVETQLIKLVR